MVVPSRPVPSRHGKNMSTENTCRCSYFCQKRNRPIQNFFYIFEIFRRKKNCALPPFLAIFFRFFQFSLFKRRVFVFFGDFFDIFAVRYLVNRTSYEKSKLTLMKSKFCEESKNEVKKPLRPILKKLFTF